jgi:glutathione synthase/RimK-type ligase-like ATP-grasp enzyme
LRRCAFLTLDEPGDFVIDDEHAVAPLARLGWTVDTVSWRQTRVPWSQFDAVIIRSTWDYWHDIDSFLAVLSGIDRQSRLANALPLVLWNLEKTYLRDLEARGVGIVPTLWPRAVGADDFTGWSARLGSDQLVVKPVVGANGEDAWRVAVSDPPSRRERIAARFQDRPALVQPFMPRILDEGEYSLFFLGGRYSHAILKTPAPGDFRSQEERGAAIQPVQAPAALRDCGARVMNALDGRPLYARVDFVRGAADDFRLMELELIEPSLYLRTDSDAPRHFAAAIDAWFG